MSASRADQQFCLRWNSFHTNLASSFHALRQDEEFVDVTLAAEGQLIKAHRVILSACSPFFKEILKDTPCRHPVIVLNGVRAAHVRDLLRFMYEGQVNLTPEQMPEFLRAAQALHIKGLFDRDAQHHTTGADAQESTSAAPPHLLDSRTTSKRSDPASDPAPPSSAPSKRARLAASPPLVEPIVKMEPASPPECRADEAGERTQASDSTPAPATRTEPAATAHTSEPTERTSRHFQSSASQEGTSRSQSGGQERGRSAAGGGQPATSIASSSDPDYVVTHTAYPFPCPFCEKSYTSWGFRRRHIKAFHTAGPTLKCKWCWQLLPSHDEWCAHVTGEHHLSAGDAQHALQILDEANLVLQSSEPLRLESLVDMVKRQQRRTNSASPETPIQGAASS